MVHTVKGFDIVYKAEVDVFLELSFFFDEPVDVGSLISGSLPFLNPAILIQGLLPFQRKSSKILCGRLNDCWEIYMVVMGTSKEVKATLIILIVCK